MRIVSVRGFSVIHLIVDAKSRTLWKFSTPGKRPPVTILRLFLTQLKVAGRSTMRVRTDLGGEFSRCSDICGLLPDEFKCNLQTTGGYSSWINGKAERHIRTLENMERRTRCDSNLPAMLWCFSLDYATYLYGSLYHSSIN